MKSRRILILDGHPDARAARFLHALAAAYREGAEGAGHEVRTITLAELDFPLLRTADEFAGTPGARHGLPRKLLAGRSARIVVTMGMPSLFYRLVYRAHSLKSLERDILGFCGLKPVRSSVIGMVEASVKARRAWLARMRQLGQRAA